jgi:hypothetical protein
MVFKVERCFSQGDSAVFLLSGRSRGRLRQYRLRIDGDYWSRTASTAALDLLAVELPEVSRRSIRFRVV